MTTRLGRSAQHPSLNVTVARQAREALGLTQAQFARLLGVHLGRVVSQYTVSHIERGTKGASQEMADAIVAVLAREMRASL